MSKTTQDSEYSSASNGVGVLKAIIEHLLAEGRCADDDIHEGHSHFGDECEWEKVESLIDKLGVLPKRPRPADEPPECPWCGADEIRRSDLCVDYVCGSRLGVKNKYADRTLECRVRSY